MKIGALIKLFMHILNHVKALEHYIIVTLHGTDKTTLGFRLI